MNIRCSCDIMILTVSTVFYGRCASFRLQPSSAIRSVCSRSKCEQGYHHHPWYGREVIESSFLLPTPNASLRPRSRGIFTKQFSADERGEKLTLESVAKGIVNGNYKNIIVLCGAGISVAAGIPDFRSPGTGLYDNLHKFNLPYPEAIFELQYYRKNPLAFITLAKDLWPTGQRYKPTISHSFMKLLESKGILLRVYTQNIDGLEVLAGISRERLVECHGHFSSASCIDCGEMYDIEKCRMEMLRDPPIVPTCLKCGVQGTVRGRVKPDIVFFGEELPQRFSTYVDVDTGKCDLLLILGTSLQVYPVASIPQLVDCPVVLFNREDLNTGQSFFNGIKNIDVFEKGDCDVSIKKLCSKIGLFDELVNTHETTLRRLGDDMKELKYVS